jgi:hypothetical protein
MIRRRPRASIQKSIPGLVEAAFGQWPRRDFVLARHLSNIGRRVK